jgi:AraC-like DNA-binding protein
MLPSFHLGLQEQQVRRGEEWIPSSPGLTFVGVGTGDGFLLQPGRPQQIQAGDLIICSARTAAALRASLLGELTLHYFHVRIELLGGILTPSEEQQIAQTLKDDGWLPQYWAQNSPLADQFRHLGDAHRHGQDLLARCQMLHLAVAVLTARLPHRPAPVPAVAELTASARFERLICEMPAAELQYRSTAELAKLCGCGVRHFRRLFKENFGRPLTSKRTELRLAKACDLLANTQGKIIEVALDSGFQQLGLFTAAFKKRYGVTPSRWRQRHRAATTKPKTGTKPAA